MRTETVEFGILRVREDGEAKYRQAENQAKPLMKPTLFVGTVDPEDLSSVVMPSVKGHRLRGDQGKDVKQDIEAAVLENTQAVEALRRRHAGYEH